MLLKIFCPQWSTNLKIFMLNKNINPKESVLHIGVVQSHHQMSDHSSEFSIKQLHLPAETGQIARQISLLLLLVMSKDRVESINVLQRAFAPSSRIIFTE
jgi:hypothetical protein